MEPTVLTLIDLYQEAGQVHQYKNIPLSFVNDHTVRLSIMTEPFYWHSHPNSDETFLVIEGILCIDLEEQTVELASGQLFTVPAKVMHRTWPKDGRSVNVTFELADIQTIKLEGRQ